MLGNSKPSTPSEKDISARLNVRDVGSDAQQSMPMVAPIQRSLQRPLGDTNAAASLDKSTSGAMHNDPKEPLQSISVVNRKPTAAISGLAALAWKADVSKRMKMKVLTDVCADPTLIYLAACRILSAPNLQGDTDKKYIEEYIDDQKCSDAAIDILCCESADEEVTRVNKFMRADLKTDIYPGLLELFTKAELYYMLSGDRVVTSLEAAENQALLKKTQNRLQTCNEFRQRVLQLGLTRFREWLEHESQLTDPYTSDTKQQRGCPVSPSGDLASCEAALRQLGKDVSKLTTATEFLEVWQKVARPTSVDSLRGPLMRQASRDKLRFQQLSIDNTRSHNPLESWLSGYPSTLVLCGEAGSGKTQCALALARESEVLCVYMLAEHIARHLDRVVREMEALSKTPQVLGSYYFRNEKWASCIVQELVAIHRQFSIPMNTAAEYKKCLLIIVDDAGAYPELVRSMSSLLSLRGPRPYAQQSLATHLKIESVRLAVVGAGANAYERLTGSSPQHFRNVQMPAKYEWELSMKSMTDRLHKALPWFESFTRSQVASAEVRQLAAIKDNARMYSFFIEAAESSAVFQRISAQHKENADVRLDDHECLAELRQCVSAALTRFVEVGSIGRLSHAGMKQAVCKALLFAQVSICLRASCDRELECDYGILVDVLECRAVEHDGKVRDPWSWSILSLDGDVFTMMSRIRHRYTMSAAMRALAMWILGIDDTAITADALAVETQIALHAGDTLLRLAVTAFFDRWSGAQRSLGIGYPFESSACRVVGPDAVTRRMSVEERQAKRTVISESQSIPERERAILLGLFDYLAALPESALVTTDVLSAVDDGALEVVLGTLLGESDADREAKVRRWVATLRQRDSLSVEHCESSKRSRE